MPTTTSHDGTTIAYLQEGSGPVIVLVSGALGTKDAGKGLIDQLKDRYTVISYDRRGRVDSGDTQPYAVDREIDDLEAVIDAAGGTAAVYGMSSGGILALDAANRLADKITKVFLYEPPVIVEGARKPLPDNYVDTLYGLIDAGKNSDAVAYFLTTAVGIPDQAVAGMQQSPMWQGMAALAHTLRYDDKVAGALMSGTNIPANRWPNITAPVRVVVGGKSEPFFQQGADAIVANLTGPADTRQIPGQDHNVNPVEVAALVRAFLGDHP